MKKLVFTLATALLTLVNVNAETTVNEVNGGKKHNDTTVVRPVSACDATTVDVIAEDKRITEAVIEQAAPLLPGKSQEEIIADDNLVVENNTAKEIFPLDVKQSAPKKTKKTLKRAGERFIGSL